MLQKKYLDAYLEYQSNPLLTIKDLEQKYHFSKSSFYRALKKENYSLPIQSNKIVCDEDKLLSALEMYKKGISIIKISKELNMGEATISKFLKYKNIEIRNRYDKIKDISLNHYFFENIDNEHSAYWLGFIFADGSIINSKSYRLVIELNKIDEDHLKKFIQDINTSHIIKYRNNRDMCSISINSKNIINDLCSIGCIPNKTVNGYINEELIKKENIKDFLRGYLDGDGFIDKTRYRIVYTIKSKMIVESIKKMFDDNGILSKIINEKNYYRLTIETKNNFFKALKFLYDNSNIYLDRKYNIYRKRLLDLQPS